MGDYVSDEHLFNATLRENICMGRKDVSLKDVMEICKMVDLSISLFGVLHLQFTSHYKSHKKERRIEQTTQGTS
jgi:ABC-type multidrug transport system fused ATPase/permease subunit